MKQALMKIRGTWNGNHILFGIYSCCAYDEIKYNDIFQYPLVLDTFFFFHPFSFFSLCKVRRSIFLSSQRHWSLMSDIYGWKCKSNEHIIHISHDIHRCHNFRLISVSFRFFSHIITHIIFIFFFSSFFFSIDSRHSKEFIWMSQ